MKALAEATDVKGTVAGSAVVTVASNLATIPNVPTGWRVILAQTGDPSASTAAVYPQWSQPTVVYFPAFASGSFRCNYVLGKV